MKAYVNRVQKRGQLLWARRHLGWTITQWKCVLWSDASVFQVTFGRNGHRVLLTKDEKGPSDCYQQQVQKPGSAMVWGCGNFHFCDGTINAKSTQRFWSNICCLQDHLFQERPCIFQQDDAKPHSAHITKGMETRGCWPGLACTDPVLWHTLRLVCRKNETKLHPKMLW